jgi:hypothetical protein
MESFLSHKLSPSNYSIVQEIGFANSNGIRGADFHACVQNPRPKVGRRQILGDNVYSGEATRSRHSGRHVLESLDMFSNSTSTVRQGQTVRFVYNGGTSPGEKRLVLVESTDKGHIAGRDLDADAYRSYRTDRIAPNTVEVVANEDEEVIRPSSFLANPGTLSDTTIFAAYRLLNPDRRGARYHTDIKAIVAKRNDIPRVEVSIDGGKGVVEFLNDSGKRLGLSFTLPAGAQPVSVKFPVEQSVLQDFARELAEHVKPAPAANEAKDAWSQFVEDQRAKGNAFYQTTGALG